MYKKALSIILIVILLSALLLSINAAAIEIDGFINEREWQNAQVKTLVSDSDIFDSPISFATAQTLLNERESIIYLCVKVLFTDDFVKQSNGKTNDYGIAISVNGGEFYVLSPLVSCEYRLDEYNINAAFAKTDASRFNAEIALGVKLGLDTLRSIKVRVTDGSTMLSNAYSIPVPQPPTEATTYQPATQPASKPDNTTGIKITTRTTTSRTTARPTTKKTTTKRVTTQRETVPKTNKPVITTLSRTTKPNTKATRSYANTTTVKVVTVYVTVPVQLTSGYSEPTLLTATTALATEESQVQTTSADLKTGKAFTYLGVAMLLVLTFGVVVIVNMKAEKNAQKKEKGEKNNK